MNDVNKGDLKNDPEKAKQEIENGEQFDVESDSIEGQTSAALPPPESGDPHPPNGPGKPKS